LDPLTARLVEDLILSTRDRLGVTSVVISHDTAQAVRLANHLLVLDKGKLVEDGPAQALRDRPGSLAGRFFAAQSGVTHGGGRPPGSKCQSASEGSASERISHVRRMGSRPARPR
jgi:ABC-type transporter Mla maintaining outer membrane lipid asymmetry ATPase subunit MlaF